MKHLVYKFWKTVERGKDFTSFILLLFGTCQNSNGEICWQVQQQQQFFCLWEIFFFNLNFLWTILQPKKFFMFIHYLFIKVFWNYLIEFLQFDKIRIIPFVNTFSFVLQLLWWDKKSKTTVIIFSLIGWQIDQKFIFIHLFILNKIMS